MRRAILATVLIFSALATPARSAFIITVADQTIPEGGTGTVDVTIRSTNLVSGDALSTFGFAFRITPSGPGGLNFSNPQSDAELTDPTYVFVGNSANFVTTSPLGSVSGDDYTGGDGTFDGSAVTVTTPRLLVRLDLAAAAGSAGQSFTISLVNPSTSTFFRDANFNDVPFSSVAGTVRITPVAVAVPEPGTLASALMGTAALSTVLFLRGRRACPRPA